MNKVNVIIVLALGIHLDPPRRVQLDEDRTISRVPGLSNVFDFMWSSTKYRRLHFST